MPVIGFDGHMPRGRGRERERERERERVFLSDSGVVCGILIKRRMRDER